MKSRATRRAAARGAWLAPVLAGLCGCAPRELERAVVYHVERERVGDAAARRTRAAWFLRFDAELLHDLGAAIADGDAERGRESGEQTLGRAQRLWASSTRGEIDRLSPAARAELARRAGCEPDPSALSAAVEARARAALEAELTSDRGLAPDAWRRRMGAIRDGVEPLPDERGRLARRVLLAGLAPAVAKGVERQEDRIRDALRERERKPIPRAEVWAPDRSGGEPRERWAPIIAVEWPDARDYPDDYDRIGRVCLSGTRERVLVSIDPRRPCVYAYTSSALIHGRKYAQQSYVWWFSDRPAMTADDAAAGHVDGGTLRLTLDRSGRPAIAEAIMNCGCGHEVYVAADVEAAARREFGPPVPDANYSVETRPRDRRPILVAGTFDRAGDGSRPMLVLDAGTHEPRRLEFGEPASLPVREVVAERRYETCDYDDLDRLPLGDGLASMFGSDGLVHYAGRREGYLLAPTGMLSAGQPRKRGTQRVRWDDYYFDDPALLEALRLPGGF